jgi:hypothetical protein
MVMHRGHQIMIEPQFANLRLYVAPRFPWLPIFSEAHFNWHGTEELCNGLTSFWTAPRNLERRPGEGSQTGSYGDQTGSYGDPSCRQDASRALSLTRLTAAIWWASRSLVDLQYVIGGGVRRGTGSSPERVPPKRISVSSGIGTTVLAAAARTILPLTSKLALLSGRPGGLIQNSILPFEWLFTRS